MTHQQHPSFGCIQWSRVHGQRSTLFRSHVSHSSWIEMEISRADEIYDHHHTRVYQRDRLIKVAMTEEQFATFVSSGSHQAVPCTISRLMGEDVPVPPRSTDIERFYEGVVAHSAEVSATLREAAASLQEIIDTKGPIQRGALRAAQSKLDRAVTDIDYNLPFFVDLFLEFMERAQSDALNGRDVSYELPDKTVKES